LPNQLRFASGLTRDYSDGRKMPHAKAAKSAKVLKRPLDIKLSLNNELKSAEWNSLLPQSFAVLAVFA